MKIKRQNHTVLFRGLVLVIAFALAILCAPIDGIIAFATALETTTDCTYMTIGKVSDEIDTTANKGTAHNIPKAYIGGSSDYVVGQVAKEAEVALDFYTITESSVSVHYGAYKAGVEGETITETPEGNYFGTFTPDKVGTYTITYSYKYKDADENVYSNSYQLEIDSELASATISFEENTEKFIPSIIDMAVVEKAEVSADLPLVKPVIKDEDGNVEDYTLVTDIGDVESTGRFAVVTVKNAAATEEIVISGQDEEFYIDGDTFKDPTKGAGKYTIRYAYYEDGNFITATTKSVQVYANDEDNKYYTDYKLQLDLASDWTDNGQTGVESTLPKAIGLTSKKSKPASEQVDVYYTVKVFFDSTSSSKNYEALSNASEGYEGIFNEDGTLINPTKFKPMKDGNYSFVYTITDFYENTTTCDIGVYEFKNVKDEQNPTPIVYIADGTTNQEMVDATDKLASRSVPNGVVVYAIGMEDNVSKVGDDDVVLTRKIMTDETVSKLTITDYNDKNLVFNYRATTTKKAWENLRENNYIIAEQTESVSSDVEMLEWLAEHGYMIVVDDANAEYLFDIFSAENFFSGDLAEFNEFDKAKDWFKTNDAVELGFAYIKSEETFGAATKDGGMGSGQYYIHYIAKDAAGNEKDVSKSMYIGAYEDIDAPEIKFSTTLADSYLPNATITFNAPTPSDNYDTNMVVKTYYRYKNSSNDIITTVNNEDGENVAVNTLPEIDTLGASYVGNGYIDLTDKNASSYTIDLSEETTETAVKLEIVAFAYDDKGNIGFYAETIAISNTNDNAPPQFKSLSRVATEYEQGQEVELPTLTVLDDAVSFMSFDVDVYYVNGDTKTKISTYDYSSEREILSQSGAGKYTVNAGKFMASFAGEYEATISVKDSNNKTVVSFAHFTVSERTIIQPPVINTSLESKTIELDGDSNYDPKTGILLPTPSVSYEISNSVDYETFSKAEEGAYADTKYVVMGVDENGKATNYSTTYGQKGSFKPTEIGEYPIMYTVNLTVYDHNKFEFKPMSWNGTSYDEGGYFLFTNETNGKSAKVTVNKDGVYEIIEVTDSQGETASTYYMEKINEDIVVYDGVYGSEYDIISDLTQKDIFVDVDLDSWFKDLKLYALTSDVYTIIVKDTKGPKIAEYDYVDTISSNEINTTDGKVLTIYGIEATDASNINEEKSKIVLSWKLANGETGSKTFEKQMKNTEYTIKSNNGNDLDGTYKITYTVYDNNNNYSTKEYSIAVGDNVAPTLTFDDNFVKDSYQLKDLENGLKIEFSKIHSLDNKTDVEEMTPVVTLKNTATGEKITEVEELEGANVYSITEVGTYTLTIEVEDAVGNKTTKTFSIEVSANSTDTVATYQTVGTILIVVSVLVLAGVIIYFIVSKVKLDKELKK